MNQIVRSGKKIGQIFVNSVGGSLCSSKTIQVCGFDRIDGPWGCGPFPGHRDIHLIFDEECEHDWKSIGTMVSTQRDLLFCSKCKLYKVEK